MCGIAGIIGKGSVTRLSLAAMARTIVRRGPDDEGLWQDSEALVGFAFRRLAIVDLYPAGHQPMHSADRRWTIAFNGDGRFPSPAPALTPQVAEGLTARQLDHLR